MRSILLIGLLLLCSFTFADVTGTAREGFFEPSPDQYNESWKEIGIQQAMYKAAKEAGNFDEACRKALFNFQLAWLHQNKAIGWLKSEPLGIVELSIAISLFEEAIAYCEAGGSHFKQRADCHEKAIRSMTWAINEKKRLETLKY